MATMNFQTNTSDFFDAHRSRAAQSACLGTGWSDSSWELLRGLDVIEDLPPDAWPLDLAV